MGENPPLNVPSVPAPCNEGRGVCELEEGQLELFPELSKEEQSPKSLADLESGNRTMRFVSEYFITNNATKSYLAAGYNCSEESARRAGSRLLSRVDIQAALVHLDKQVQESALVSKRNVIESIQKTRATAEKEGGTANLRVVSECDRLLAQIKGMFKDKVEHSGEIIATVSEWRKITKEAKEAEVLEAKNNA